MAASYGVLGDDGGILEAAVVFALEFWLICSHIRDGQFHLAAFGSEVELFAHHQERLHGIAWI